MTLTSYKAKVSYDGEKPFQAFPINSLVTVVHDKELFLHVHQFEVSSLNILEATVIIFSLFTLVE